MYKQLWMGMEPQPLHNCMVCIPAVWPKVSADWHGSTWAVVTGCRWFQIPILCIWSGSYKLNLLNIDVQAALDGYGASTKPCFTYGIKHPYTDQKHIRKLSWKTRVTRKDKLKVATLTCDPYERLVRFSTIRLCRSASPRKNIWRLLAGSGQPKENKCFLSPSGLFFYSKFLSFLELSAMKCQVC